MGTNATWRFEHSKAALRLLAIAFLAGFVLPHRAFAQADSLKWGSPSKVLVYPGRPNQSRLAQAPDLTLDTSRGEMQLRFSGMHRQLEPASAAGLSALIAERQADWRPDSTVSHHHTILLLLEDEADRLMRMDRMAAIAAALNHAGVDCEKIRVGTVEDSSQISYYKKISTRQFKARKRTIQMVLLGDDTQDFDYQLDFRSSFLGYLSDFLPE